MPDSKSKADFELYLGITPPVNTPRNTHTHQRRWILILLNPSTQKCNWYYAQPITTDTSSSTSASNHERGKHRHSKAKDQPYTLNVFTQRLHIGTIQYKYLDLFEHVFYKTEITSSKQFAGLFLQNLADEGLVERAVACDVYASCEPGREWEHLRIEVNEDEDEELLESVQDLSIGE
ncbi:hypothetical protein BDV18DRAFT_161698 [Aspergillus unguis]